MIRKEDSKNGLTNVRKIFYSLLVISIAAFLISGIYAVDLSQDADDPTAGFNIHVSVGRHDHANLDAQFDHYCKLTPPIVATCLLFSEGESGDQILSEVEYIITRDQYLQLPLRERPNWHDHAVELTPERGMPQCVSLPEGLECGALVSILRQTYGKVVVLWDPSDPTPNYPPYTFLVDSPFALEQDLNHELHKIWKVGDESTSSAHILPDDEDEEDDDEGMVVFRTNVMDEDYSSTRNGWIALDLDNDGNLEGFGRISSSSWSNSRCKNIGSCEDSDVPCKVAKTPSGYDVVDYGINNRLLVCDAGNNNQVFYDRGDEDADDAVLSTNPTEPFSSKGLEVVN